MLVMTQIQRLGGFGMKRENHGLWPSRLEGRSLDPDLNNVALRVVPCPRGSHTLPRMFYLFYSPGSLVFHRVL